MRIHHPQLLENVHTTFHNLENKKSELSGLKQQKADLNEKQN